MVVTNLNAFSLIFPMNILQFCVMAVNIKWVIKSLIIPITGPKCPEASRKLRFSDYVTKVQNDGKVVSLMHRPFLHPGNIPDTHFC